ncbi:Signal-transducing adaptor protein 2 [Bagarius yarrelli]|uniref:Signal-transducing adaptor protein 2 n=1 Tax=Bagarius yarrelli TaxID=175774 RepID=A0A556VCQ6_BAGYA|nr:Signal-transducing adaptor protein 2 [Bagarius yarrelli]
METPRRAPRTKSQLPPCYYEGFLEKRSFKDKIGRKFWASLCGNCLFFYNHSKDSNAPSLETRELWKGFIISVVKLLVPTTLNLLPGQIHMLKEAVDKEIERLKENMEKSASAKASITVATTEPGNYLSILSEMPAVPREEAQVLLEKNKDKGNLLLRPSQHGSAFAVTTRQEFNGPVFRHYRVTRIPKGGFAIDWRIQQIGTFLYKEVTWLSVSGKCVINLINHRSRIQITHIPISCTSLHDVIIYLMEKTGVFKPLVLEHMYEESIDEEDVPPIVKPRNPVKPLVPLESMPDLLIGPNGALLPPASRPRSASVTPDDYKPKWSPPPMAVRYKSME